MREFIRLAIQNLSHRKVRSWLTMVGIVIGITAVVAIISLGQGMQAAINDQFNELGVDKIFIQPGGSSFGGPSSVILDEDDRRVIENVRGVEDTIGMGWKNARVQYKDEEVFSLVTGYTLQDGEELWNDMQKGNIEEGRLLTRADTFKAFVGIDFTRDDEVFKRGARLHDKITINDVDFEIVGIQEDLGNDADNQAVHISDDAYERLFGEQLQDKYQYIVARSQEGENPSEVADRIERALRNHRNLDEGEEDFSLQTTEEFMESANSILGIINAVIVGIAAVSLIIGGIGIMNTMYTAVVERTQEIGIMKAIGARNKDVLLIFLTESGMLGLAGGIAGIVIGLLISKIVEIAGALWVGTPLLRAWWSWELIAFALLFSFLAGALSGLAPAWQASKQKPVESLRYE